jgi:tripartite ATP-independent transporter DctM subunit
MSNEIALTILFLSFFFLFSVGVPLGFSLFFSSILTVALDPNLLFLVVPQRIFTGINVELLLSIPGFLFSALMMNRIGITKDIVDLSDLLVGRIRGGLAHINVVSSMLMGGVSGSSTADVAGIGAILIPTMKEKGYSGGFSAAITAASSTIGSVIPPSILMIIYGASAEVSIGALFIAGYVPGILVGLQQLIIAWYYAKKNNLPITKTQYTKKQIAKILIRGLIPVSVIGVIIGGILGGIMTATESAAVASVYVVFVGVFVYRRVSFEALSTVALETAKLTAVVMFCVGTAKIFGWLMQNYGIIDVAGDLLQNYASNSIIFLSFAAIMFLVLGTFMDPAPAMLIFVPILAPIAPTVGVDPLQLGIIIIMTLAIGKITPPYGISILLACTIAKVPLSKGMGWTLVFFGSFCFLILLMIIFPQMTLYLPQVLAPDLMGIK